MNGSTGSVALTRSRIFRDRSNMSPWVPGRCRRACFAASWSCAAELQHGDARHYHPRRSGIAAVDQDVALRSSEQERGDVVRADAIRVARDAKRLDRLLAALHACLTPCDEEIDEGRGEKP